MTIARCMDSRKIGIGGGVLALAVAAAIAALAFFDARDDATVLRTPSPGVARAAGEAPPVRSGNVLLLYRDLRSAAPLRALADELSGPPDPALEAAGQAVIVRRSPQLPGPVRALSAARRLDGRGAGDPAVRGFAEFWLGRAR